VGRKNRQFVGGHEGGDRSAVILTVIANAHRHDLDASAYLRGILKRLAKGDGSGAAVAGSLESQSSATGADVP
jgi:hypothetical protein